MSIIESSELRETQKATRQYTRSSRATPRAEARRAPASPNLDTRSFLVTLRSIQAALRLCLPWAPLPPINVPRRRFDDLHHASRGSRRGPRTPSRRNAWRAHVPIRQPRRPRPRPNARRHRPPPSSRTPPPTAYPPLSAPAEQRPVPLPHIHIYATLYTVTGDRLEIVAGPGRPSELSAGPQL